MTLNDQQLDRYARHIVLRDIGGGGQSKLLSSHVLLIGAGGFEKLHAVHRFGMQQLAMPVHLHHFVASEQDVAVGAHRLARQIELGIVPPDTQLSPRDSAVPDWNDVPDEQRRLFCPADPEQRMEAKASRISCTYSRRKS